MGGQKEGELSTVTGAEAGETAHACLQTPGQDRGEGLEACPSLRSVDAHGITVHHLVPS